MAPVPMTAPAGSSDAEPTYTPKKAVAASSSAPVKGVDNPNNIDYKQFDYFSVQRFTPLTNTNWYGATSVNSVTIDDWCATLSVNFAGLDNALPQATHDVKIEVTSYECNAFRVRFNPDGPIEDFPNGPIVRDQLNYIRSKDGGNPRWTTDDAVNALVFETKDLDVFVNANTAITVRRKRDGELIYQDDVVDGKSRGLMFVTRDLGNAVASVRLNRKDYADVDEAFYGAGQVVAENRDGDYFLERTGLAMTNYNYDNLMYNQPGVIPPELDDEMPNYYIPMYYAAPWLVVQGHRGNPDKQYSYGWFYDQTGQSYMNTGDARFAGAADKAYMGSAVGPMDSHFIFGHGDGIEPVVNAFSLLQGKEHEGQKLNKRAAMPPKYVFGFFQGVYGVRGLTRENVECTPENNYNTWDDVVSGYQDNNFPFEGMAVDIDVQDNMKVFTTRPTFWTAGHVGQPGDENNKSVFAWAHDKGLVTQTNITCFVRSDQENYGVYEEMCRKGVYTKNDAADADKNPGPFATNTAGPDDAYCGKLNYGGGDDCKAIFPDWGHPDTPGWWGPNYATLFKLGLDFVWQDMTVPAMAPHIRGQDIYWEPDWDYLQNVPRNGEFNWKSYHPQVMVHDMRKNNGDREPFLTQRNLHAYTLCKATRNEGIIGQQESLTKFKRSYIIARGGYIGNQHFGGLWVGDNASSQDYLQMMITTAINMNMSCLSVVGADIGGFTGTDGRNPCPENLMNRWVQAGCLMPWFRDHYDRWVDNKPHGKNFQELYAYSNMKESMKQAVELRYRWQEVLYTAMYQNVTVGAPLLKAMSMWNGDATVNLYQKDQFMLGGHDGFQILCAPITHINNYTRDVYLPKGANWMQYNIHGDNNKMEFVYEGGQTLYNFWVPDSDSIIFVREGAILPTRYTKEKGVNKSLNTYSDADPLVFEVFGLTEGCKGELYIDDGGATTQAEDEGTFTVMTVDGSNQGANGIITISSQYSRYYNRPPYYLRVRNTGDVKNVHSYMRHIGDKTFDRVEISDKYELFDAADNSYWVDEATESLWIKMPIFDITYDMEIHIETTDSVYVK